MGKNWILLITPIYAKVLNYFKNNVQNIATIYKNSSYNRFQVE
ncbi:hypothetical protein AZO1586I_386 [Bathymodiolus thermophilus thioautotrophic gill symbiont]|uniref:Uncharacterized protein n=3 Tax=sulfur-oxidizing symbionts TaxID=32036 RepID=A0ACA8ZMQ9_9GAMM|nr:hypothetical protein AZO1586R_110 [Bathymodiolus azoricus thioautotrophic gill symbiont]CAB5498765.1 hypothetical protein AZO1586I_386 [Bathymodiolus thermophilus thioautotrophic gill symbiont]CAC9525893.1 hypothetical protein [uncultured Gammaproteobacteria bacterium]CAC9529419.1 hypothetical protein [uncultured Gammaproteobacteria bacterium]CAC9990415.1 hypothetical protein [uncultured Gammaproteobacteria bacterium]